MDNFRKTRLKSSTLRQDNNIKDVNSPLAKFDSAGKLKCVICKTIIKSATVWKAHINSKQHKFSIECTKNLHMQKSNQLSMPKDPESAIVNANVNKALSKESNHQNVQLLLQQSITDNILPKEGSTIVKETALPEKFFDDPLKDAKVRKIEYKSEQDDEWERFQKEIKEESMTSCSIIAGELTIATTDRQIDEIDEQMHRWTRVISLEKQIKSLLERETKNAIIESTSESDADEDNEFEEYLDWRSKKF